MINTTTYFHYFIISVCEVSTITRHCPVTYRCPVLAVADKSSRMAIPPYRHKKGATPKLRPRAWGALHVWATYKRVVHRVCENILARGIPA